MKCSECNKYMPTATEGHGVCSFPTSYFPTKAELECPILAKKILHCKDCSHFGTDTACMTAVAEDPVNKCPGFESLNNEICIEYIIDEVKNGKSLDDILSEIKSEIESSEFYNFITETKSRTVPAIEGNKFSNQFRK